MRLIDADKLIKGRVENDPVVIAAKCTPTAYDVDKIVEQLDQAGEQSVLVTLKAAFKVAGDIVKSGGIEEEKKDEWKEHFTSRFGRIE